MTTKREENTRASSYASSDKPLFQARNIDRKIFTRARAPKDEPVLGPDGVSPASRSRIPRKSSPAKATASLVRAYERASREDAEGGTVESIGVTEAVRDGSPSPAPRPRPVVRESLREKDERRMNRLRDGMAITRSSPLAFNGARSAEHAVEDDSTTGTIGSGSGGSVSGSGASLGEDFTDEALERRMQQYARDQERAKEVLGSQKGLFARRGVGARVHETGSTLARRSSGSSIESEPGIRIPSNWGSKARARGSWMQRIMSPDNSGDIQSEHQRASSEGLVDWVGAAVDVPLPSIEDGSVTQEPTPPHSRPSSAQPANTSFQKSHIWEADDFTANSVLMSTSPQLRIRNPRLDDIREAEIESSSKRAVATGKLEEIRERNSEERSISPERLRRPSRDTFSEAPSAENRDDFAVTSSSSESNNERGNSSEGVRKASANILIERGAPGTVKDNVGNEAPIIPPKSASRKRSHSPEKDISAIPVGLVKAASSNTSVQQDYSHEKTILEEEGEAIPGTPITIFKGAASDEKKGHTHDDSWDALRKLAKVASPSPSPSVEQQDEKLPKEARKHSERPVLSKRSSTASTPKSDVDPEERIQAEASLFELPDLKYDPNSTRNPSLERDGSLEATPRPRVDPLSLPTPVVTGAYIDTPAPRGRLPRISRRASSEPDIDDVLQDEVSRLAIKDFIRNSSSRSGSANKVNNASQSARDRLPGPLSSHPVDRARIAKPRSRSRPLLTNTANPASVKDDLRRIQQEAQIEDSTLDNFDELLAAEGDDPNSTTIMEVPLDLERDSKGRPLSEKERERRQEISAYERMAKSIKSGLLNIRDAKRGIERLEDRVSSSPEPMVHTHNHHHCTACASLDPWYHVTFSVPKLWVKDPTSLTGVRFTWWGLPLVLFITWFILESLTCEYICHPKYAIVNEWHPSDPFWGWALPTLVDRWTGGILKFCIKYMWRLLLWIWSSWTDLDSSGRGRGMGSGAHRKPVKPPDVTRSWTDGSMFEDETL
jgi:hypothetical protein